MLFGTVSGALCSGLIDDPDLVAVLERAEEALGWMTTPDGSMATIGDTDYFPGLKERETLSHLSNEGTIAALEAGGDEAAIPAGVKSYPEAGYAFARFRREGRPPSDDAYLAQIACFHSRVHKHADHLSFVWNDAGVRILVDPGRYDYGEKAVWGDENSVQGFFYSDPKRIYVERTRAHNCVEIDGRDYPRKRVEPFGSALRFAAEVDGMAVTVCDTRHLTRHRRTLILGPGAFLLVLDWLGYKNGPERGFKQWFQLGPEWTAVAEAEGLRARCGDLDLRAKSLVEGSEIGPIHLGETEPMQGWMSPCASELVPSPSFCFQATGATVRFATLFSLSDELEIKSAALNNSLTSGRVRWFDNRETHDVSFRKTDEDGVEAQWRRTP